MKWFWSNTFPHQNLSLNLSQSLSLNSNNSIQNKLVLTPNPAKDLIILNTKEIENYSILNNLGQEIEKGTAIPNVPNVPAVPDIPPSSGQHHLLVRRHGEYRDRDRLDVMDGGCAIGSRWVPLDQGKGVRPRGAILWCPEVPPDADTHPSGRTRRHPVDGAFVASLVPAWRATRVNPVVALKTE